MKTWAMPLHQRPVVVAGGIVEHGRHGPLDRWLLQRSWTLHVYSYHADLVLDGETHAIRPGCAGVIAPGVEQEYRYRGISRHVFVHFELPARGPMVPVPVLADLGESLPGFRSRLEAITSDLATQPLRCSVRVWDLLWDLAAIAAAAADDDGPTGDPRLAEALAIIERELEQDLSVAELAQRVGLSHNQLTRLFRANHASTVVGFIRRRRVERAVHLLAHTDMPVRSIAAGVGIADPQVFNKTVRAVTGKAPSDFRRR